MRIHTQGVKVDASTTLYDGTRLNGPASLRDGILKYSDAFISTLTQKLLAISIPPSQQSPRTREDPHRVELRIAHARKVTRSTYGLPRCGESWRLGGERGLSYPPRAGESYLSLLKGGGDLPPRLPTSEGSRSLFSGSGDLALAFLGGDLTRSSLRSGVSLARELLLGDGLRAGDLSLPLRAPGSGDLSRSLGSGLLDRRRKLTGERHLTLAPARPDGS